MDGWPSGRDQVEHRQSHPSRAEAGLAGDWDGQMIEDVIALHDEPAPADGRPLLAEVMRGGTRTWRESLPEARQCCRDCMASLPASLRQIEPGTCPARLSGGLETL